MTKPQQNLLRAIESAGVISWTSLLATPNDAKHFSTRQSRNAIVATELISLGLVRRALPIEVGHYIAAYNRQTVRIIRHLKSATEKGQWNIVRVLAETLQYRNIAEEFDLYTLVYSKII
jgi:hypothetical protein